MFSSSRHWLNIGLLSYGMALSQSGMLIYLSLISMVGFQLAPSPALTTLPFAIQSVFSALASYPVAYLMAWLGRKWGIILGQLFGIGGASLMVAALMLSQFWLLIAACVLFGIYFSLTQQIRFAAAELVPTAMKDQAVSLVIGAAVVASILGPGLSTWGESFGYGVPFVGSFAAIIPLCLMVAMGVLWLRVPVRETRPRMGGGRPLSQILKAGAWRPMVAAAVSFAMMAFVMIATPLSMNHAHFHVSDSNTVVQFHSLGMFLPGLFLGPFLKRFGPKRLILAGIGVFVLAILINLQGMSFWHYFSGLLLVGVAWSLMFVSATSWLTRYYRPDEAARVQSFNDFCVFMVVAVCGFFSGKVLATFGWEGVNLVMLPSLALVALICLLEPKTSPLADKTAGSTIDNQAG
ncbi:MFS transporter [Oceanisphaera arctica]|uniref:Major facilitator superfamily (MFS) profile domain-containing protein n=1 Tax=Oceanisphaera arctica TaxID=641510 RepID=A0A2P5TLK2_9GAMM|nr:MFS transporter [Oceanisphaera arctica]PPL16154.1 hypothetical protein UN63_09935 [Oceanisphaera arctica]GHA06498.1 MFS transporter [Oceanisphaera arctica]